MVARNSSNSPVTNPTAALKSPTDGLGVAASPPRSVAEPRLRSTRMESSSFADRIVEAAVCQSPGGETEAPTVAECAPSAALEQLRVSYRIGSDMDNSRFDDIDYINTLLCALRERAVAVSRMRARIMAIRAEHAKRVAASVSVVKFNRRRSHQGGKSPPNGPAVPAVGASEKADTTMDYFESTTPYGNDTRPVASSEVSSGTVLFTCSQMSCEPAPCTALYAPMASCSAAAAVGATAVTVMSSGAHSPISSSFMPASAGDFTATGKDKSIPTGGSAPRFD